MKFTVLIALLVLLAIVSAKKYKTPKAAVEIVPQWTCARVKQINLRAAEAKANITKCQYVWFIYQELVSEYTTPQYPVCFAQLDGKCDSKIVDWKEKRNIRIFSNQLNVECEAGAQWDAVKAAIEELQANPKDADAFSTDYWACVLDTIQPFIDAQFVPFPHFPAPYLDFYNYVCQGIEAKIKNSERIALQAWFDSNNGFAKLEHSGAEIFYNMSTLWEASALQEDLVECFSSESGYFAASIFPEVSMVHNTQEQRGTGADQEHLLLQSTYETDDIPIPGVATEDGEYPPQEFECWNFYAPRKHYHVHYDSVSENGWDGNRGHPLCGPETLYIPLTYYGPMCCPIRKVAMGKPYTMNCCSESIYLPQQTIKTVRKRGRRGRRGKKVQTTVLMNSNEACYGCTCLDGYVMDMSGDYWGQGDEQAHGACVKLSDGEI